MNLGDLQIHERVHRGLKIFYCPCCTKAFATLTSLKKHRAYHRHRNTKRCIKLAKTVLKSKKGCWCKNCRKKLPNPVFLNVHAKACFSSMLNTCTFCGKKFSTKENVDTHQAFHNLSKLRKFECTSCNKGFSSFYNLKRHVKSWTVHSENCSNARSNAHVSDTTLTAVTKKFLSSTRNINCGRINHKGLRNKCHSHGKCFYKKSNLQNHKVKMHESKTDTQKGNDAPDDLLGNWNNYKSKLQCKLCPQAFSELKELVLHQQVHLPNSVRLLSCHQCGKIFNGRYNLQAHMVVHSGEKPYSCDMCGKSFAFRSCLRRHKFICKFSDRSSDSLPQGSLTTTKNQLSGQAFVCTLCNRQFAQDSELQSHISQHHCEKPFPCEFCDKKFSSEIHLKKHESFHFGLPPVAPELPDFEVSSQLKVSCEQCGMHFSQQNHLEAHMVVHTGERPFACSYCDKKFAFQHSLTRHEAGHCIFKESQDLVGIAHRCEPCGKYFSSLSRLKAHSVVHSGEKPFKCKFCGKLFSFLSCVKRHEAIHTRKKSGSFGPLQKYTNTNTVAFRNEAAAALVDESRQYTVTTFIEVKDSATHHSMQVISHVDNEASKIHGIDNLEPSLQMETLGPSHHLICNDVEQSQQVSLLESPAGSTDALANSVFSGTMHENSSFTQKSGSDLNILDREINSESLCSNEEASKVLVPTTLMSHSVELQSLDSNADGDMLFDLQQKVIVNSSDYADGKSDTFADLPHDSQAVQKEQNGNNGSTSKENTKSECGSLGSPQVKNICGVCGEHFNWASSLGTHLAHAHTDRTLRTYSCSVCDKTFKYKKYVLAHMISHSRRALKCNFCETVFRQTSALKKHLIQNHSEEISGLPKIPLKNLKCHCGKEYSKRKDFLLHEKVHTKQRLYVCMSCSKVFVHPSSLHRHQLSHNSSFKAKATRIGHLYQWNKRFRNPTKFLGHKTTRYGIKPYRCKLCNKQYSQRRQLHMHMTIHRKCHQCRICKKIFRNVICLRDHMNSHNGETVFSCDYCRATFESKDSYHGHLKSHGISKLSDNPGEDNAHKAAEKTKGDTENTSKKKKKLNSPKSTKKHVLSLLPHIIKANERPRKINHKEKKSKKKRILSLWSQSEVSEKHSCVVCLKVFKSTWALQNHMTVHLKLKPARCKFCDKIFAHNADMFEHLSHCEMDKKKASPKTDKPERKAKPYACDQCDSCFPAKSQLKAHKVVHSKEKPFSCDICGRKFSFASCLKRHSVMHLRKDDTLFPKARKLHSSSIKIEGQTHPQVQYRCEDCSQVFCSLPSLHDHLCQHVGILPYKCPDCESQFFNLNGLRQHRREAHTHKKRVHVCEVCGKVFGLLRQLRTHLNIHSETLAWICEMCGSGFASWQKLKKHQTVKCEVMDSLQECDECHISFVSANELKKHKLATHEVPGANDLVLLTGVPCKLNLQNYQCEDCHKVFSRQRHLRKHLESCRKETSFSCATCGEKFVDIKLLEKHIDDFHNVTNKINAHIITSKKRQRRSRGFNPSGRKHFRCDVCGKQFVSALQLSNHIALHTGDMSVICECCGASFTHVNALHKHQTQTSCGASDGRFTCKFCDEKFETLRELRVHNSSKLGPRFKCKKCDASFVSCYRVQRHQAMCKVGKTPKFNICEVCGKNFSNASNLNEHMITHTGEKPFACGQCGRRFGHMAALRRHLSVHGGDLPFKCKVCDKGFTIASALKKHEDSHLDVKSRQVFKCEECGKGFVTRQRLKRHAYLHADEKPLKCEFCGKGFINPFHMKNHLIQHHGIPHEEHRCKFCGLIFTSRFQLTQHQDLNCTQLAETISQLLPTDGPANPTLLENLRDDEPVETSSVLEEEAVPGEEYVATQTTEIIIQEDDGQGNITEKSIIVTLPENIDLAQWLQNGGEIQTESMDGEAISYIAATESPEPLIIPEEVNVLPIAEEDLKEIKSSEIICQYCAECCASHEELQDHLAQQHPFVEYTDLPGTLAENPVPLPESLIPKQEPIFVEDKSSQQEAPEEQRNHMCQHCGKRFARGHDLNRHILRCGQPQQVEHADDQLCIVKNEPDIAVEVKVEPQKPLVKNFMCDVCGAQYTKLSDFHCHKLNVHGADDKEKKAVTPEDQEPGVFIVKVENVSNFVDTDSKEKEPKKRSHACHLCDKVFVRKRSLQQHILTHGDRRAFKCEICQKEYAYESSLWSHMKCHEEGGRERHRCFVCGKSYIDKSYLKKHMLTHTSGTMPYICNLCSKGFLLPAGLKRHRRDVHKLSV